MNSQSKALRTCPPMETYSNDDASDENGNTCTCRTGQQRITTKATAAANEDEIDSTNDKNGSNTTQMDHDPADDSVVLGEDDAIINTTYAAPPVPTDNDQSDCGLGGLYLNDVQVDHNDEEETITELVRASGDQKLIETDQNSSMRIAFGIILRLMLPLANGVVRGIQGIRDARFLRVLKNIASSRQSLTNLVAFAANTISMNLSTVQVTHHIEPILKMLKIRPSGDAVESLPDTASSDSSALPSPILPTRPLPFLPNWKRKTGIRDQSFCTLNVLAEPPPGSPIRADIIFIHGLHGSLQNTWKQGLWENERRPVEFERPPKQPVRPPKRQRNSRTSEIRPPHEQKRARIAISEAIKQSSESELEEMERFHDARSGEGTSEFSYICDEPKDIKICAGVEYSFPTFRLRMNDNGRLLQAELESMLNEEKANPRHRSNAKLSPNDPNYSKCWPGDWLPLDCPGVRVIAVNYTTDKFLWRPLWMKKETRTNLIQRAREMAELLIEQRVGQGHPVVWVGHSKGGLFVKQILVDAWESGRPAMEPFWRSARGVFFYSVPHRGSHLASIKAPLVTRSVELIDIEKNSKYLLDLHQRFAGLYHLGHLRIEVFSFVETALTLMSVLYLRIVGVDSADPGFGDVCGIRLDHREICKPRSRDCILYKELVKMIKKVC